MKTEPNEPAHGFAMTTADGSNHIIENGLTKREYFAIMVLQGIASSPNWSGTSDISIELRTEFAIRTADQLIKELNK